MKRLLPLVLVGVVGYACAPLEGPAPPPATQPPAPPPVSGNYTDFLLSADVDDGGWLNQAGSATDLYQSIDEAVVNTTDYIREETFLFTRYWARVNVPAGALDNKTIERVEIHTRTPDNDLIRNLLRIGGTEYKPPAITVDFSQEPDYYTGKWLVNPATGEAWTAADVEAFSSADAVGVRPLLQSQTDVAQMFVRVHWS